MARRFFAGTTVAALLTAFAGNSGCGDGAPAPPTPTAPTASVRVAPTVSALSPIRGSTGGGTPVTIKGSGFQAGATVTLGGSPLAGTVQSGITILLTTAAHNEGTVDVVVTNADGQAVTLAGGYSYAAPQSFDFNGVWEGFALAHPELQALAMPRHADMDVRFTIENNLLTGFRCGGAFLPFGAPQPVKNGAFAYPEDDDVVSGRIVTDGTSVGEIHTPVCPNTKWTAVRR